MNFWRKFLNLFKRNTSKKKTTAFGEIPNPNTSGFDNSQIGVIVNNLVINAQQNILVDYNGEIIYDITSYLSQLDQLISSVNQKRARAISTKGTVTLVNINASDIGSILFKPIINRPIINEEPFIKGSIFTIWLNEPKFSLEQVWTEFTDIRQIDSYFNAALNRINVFINDVMGGKSDEEIIESLNATIPNAFGNPSY